jgi:tetratricopeptide (TPR) repeat protein
VRRGVLWLVLGCSSVAAQQGVQQGAKHGEQIRPMDAPGARRLTTELAGAGTDERIRIYQQLLADAPRDVKLQSGLILTYLQKLRETADPGYLERASELVEAMREVDGGNFEVLRFQNEIDLQRHDFKSVAERARDMLRYAPSDPGAWGNLADALLDLGEYEEAGQAYAKMFALRPNLASYNRVAFFRFVTGDAAGAIGLMKQAIEAGSGQAENTAWCWAELGDMYFKTGLLNEAGAAYDAALELFPTLHRASAGLGKVEAAMGHFDLAIRDYKRAQSIVPLIEYAAALADLYSATGNKQAAHEQQLLVAAIDKLGTANGETTNRNLAVILADHNLNLQHALELVRTEIATRPDVYTWDALAWVLFKAGHLEEARAASQKAVRLNTPEPAFYFHAGKIASAAGDDKAAREFGARTAALNAKFNPTETLAGR